MCNDYGEDHGYSPTVTTGSLNDLELSYGLLLDTRPMCFYDIFF